MGKGKIALFAVIGIGAFVAIMFIIPMMGNSFLSGNMDIKFYDEAGNLVPDPPLTGAFYDGTAQIYSFDVTLGYTVTAEGEVDNLEVTGYVKIELGTKTIWFSGEMVMSKETDSFTTPLLPIGILLAGETLTDGKTWTITVTGNYLATATDANSGNAVQSNEWVNSDTITITYKDATLGVDGYINIG